ncbi:MAG: 3'-5' exonuclease [Gammaproteobacteria bacterium]|nr:3'-5' exonuclease [Gammaproteobacteria bacterium]NIR97537.1 3'-5' exonuclease [Gammaproteobacteria bacterium]NIT63170.1 3'-5' exonuclease [Gammaproteobacteria bacterium]NIV20120.1 hypothetical protein [Gammaproteobacteria bacterium]NIX11420.1 hypothetical protein [Gammaproteobacteria bacterium]
MAAAFKTPEWLARVSRHLKDPEINRRLETEPRLRALYERIVGLDTKQIAIRPIRETRFVVLDTETTGFGVYSNDEIVAIAMLELRGLGHTGRSFGALVNPGRAIPERSSQIHGIRDEHVRDAADIDALIFDIVEFIDDAVVVGHHTNFDMRFLNKTLYRLLGCRLRNPWLDTMLMYLGHSGRMGHYTLEEVAAYCRVEITDRHTAYGDAWTTCGIFAALAPRLAADDDAVARLIQQQRTNELL